MVLQFKLRCLCQQVTMRSYPQSVQNLRKIPAHSRKIKSTQKSYIKRHPWKVHIEWMWLFQMDLPVDFGWCRFAIQCIENMPLPAAPFRKCVPMLYIFLLASIPNRWRTFSSLFMKASLLFQQAFSFDYSKALNSRISGGNLTESYINLT